MGGAATLRSMTGFGRSVQEGSAGDRIEVEIRTVNHRYLKINSRLPEEFTPWTLDVENHVKGALGRGSVSIDIRYTPVAGKSSFKINTELLKEYWDSIRALSVKATDRNVADLSRLAILPGVIEEPGAADKADDATWKSLEGGLLEALKEVTKTRSEEGKQIQVELTGKHKEITNHLEEIRTKIPDETKGLQEKVRARINKLLEGTGVAPNDEDVIREAALQADKTDVAEEVQRLQAHLDALSDILVGKGKGGGDGSVGRRLDFLAQEMLREANTMASKIQTTSLVEEILEIKLIIDMIREQAQNIE